MVPCRSQAGVVGPVPSDRAVLLHLAEQGDQAIPDTKLLFGFAKHQRDSCPAIESELDIAMGNQAQEDGDKGVMLCL